VIARRNRLITPATNPNCFYLENYNISNRRSRTGENAQAQLPIPKPSIYSINPKL